MSEPDARIETHFLQSCPLSPGETSPDGNARSRLQTLVSREAEKHRALLESEAYRNSPLAKKWRDIDRDRQADEEWNEKRRADYAAKIALEEGREVRPYTTGLTGQAQIDHDKRKKAERQKRWRAKKAAKAK